MFPMFIMFIKRDKFLSECSSRIIFSLFINYIFVAVSFRFILKNATRNTSILLIVVMCQWRNCIKPCFLLVQRFNQKYFSRTFNNEKQK
ncbi:hypothetical protein C1645_872923 [Glomus cerebriforme]|uniref:Uncharacterized protein n=1 Tax=Glomus cerebriforme TaxID=658196 RepID=A0A397TCU9_9GLOM|nr:hypothetical protein C1645_872923 [Glomus cerebriforme]